MRDPGSQDGHCGATTRAQQWRAFGECGHRALGIDAEQVLHEGDQAFAVGMQEAEVSGPAKALGQHMLEDQPQEFGAGDGAGLDPFALEGRWCPKLDCSRPSLPLRSVAVKHGSSPTLCFKTSL